LGAAVTAGTIATAKVAYEGLKAVARGVSALTNAIKNRFGSKSKEAEENLDNSEKKSINSEISEDNIIPLNKARTVTHSYNTRASAAKVQPVKAAEISEVAEKKTALKA
jgi:hypothetical protein